MRKRYFFKKILVIISFLITIISCKNEGDNAIKESLNKELIIEETENMNFAEKDYSELFNEIISNEDDNIFSSENIIGNSICEIHNRQMYKENIRIHYGLIKPTDNEMEYYKLRSRFFPNSNDSVNGGCVVSDKKYYEGYICEECNTERDKYIIILEIK
jgi:hypothetical protein